MNIEFVKQGPKVRADSLPPWTIVESNGLTLMVIRNENEFIQFGSCGMGEDVCFLDMDGCHVDGRRGEAMVTVIGKLKVEL